MTSFDVPRNQVQQAGGGLLPNVLLGEIVSDTKVNQGAIKTVSAGKRATMTGISFVVNNTGTGVRAGLGVKVGGVGSIIPLTVLVGTDLPINSGDVVLGPADVVSTIQNSGTNASVSFSFTYTEFDI